MDVNNINNNINTLNTSNAAINLERSNSSNKVDRIEEEGLALTINQYNQRRDELSLSVQAFNDGIAVSKTAQNAIEKQTEYLKNIQDKLENIGNLEDKNEIKQSINEDLRNFNQIAYETKYKSQNLLVQENEDDNSFSVNTQNSSFSLAKPSTPNYANNIFEAVNNFDLNNPESVNNALGQVNGSLEQLQTNYSQLEEFGKQLEDSARQAIKDQINLYNNKQINFGAESSDFSKSNISANVGYLVASQANIVQEQSVRLLS